MSRHGWRPPIESALRLNLQSLFAHGALQPPFITSGEWQWTCDGKEAACIGYRADLDVDSGTLTLNYSVGREGNRKPVACKIALTTLPRHYGGRIWYFVCPYTGKRARMLYKWDGIDLFCHREAIKPKPTYAIQRVSGLERINAQRWALRRKLDDRFSDLFGEPCKPERMRWATFQRYLDRDAELEAREGPFMARLLGRMGVDFGEFSQRI